MSVLKRIIKGSFCVMFLTLFLLTAGQIFSYTVKLNFSSKDVGVESMHFFGIIGSWKIVNFSDDYVLKVFRLREGGSINERIITRLYGKNSTVFLEGLEGQRRYPLAICSDISDFQDGNIEVSVNFLKNRRGKAGIAFNLKDDGSYLVFFIEPLRGTVGIMKVGKGEDKILLLKEKAEIYKNDWNRMGIVTSSKHIVGYVNDTKIVDYRYESFIEGRVGLWSEGVNDLIFDDFFANVEEHEEVKSCGCF